jgi:hypothetical protein
MSTLFKITDLELFADNSSITRSSNSLNKLITDTEKG